VRVSEFRVRVLTREWVLGELAGVAKWPGLAIEEEDDMVACVGDGRGNSDHGEQL